MKKKRTGISLAIAVMLFSLFIVLAAGLTIAAKSYYDNSVKHYSQEQAYLTARSIVETIQNDSEKLNAFMTASVSKLNQPQTVYLGSGGTSETDSQLGSAVATVTYDKYADTYKLEVTATFNQVSASYSAILTRNQQSSTASGLPGLYFTSTGSGQHGLSGAQIGTTDSPADVYIRCENTYGHYSYLQFTPDYYGHQVINGNLIIEFPASTYTRWRDTVDLNGMTINGDVYIISTIKESDYYTDGVYVYINNCKITGSIYLYGKLYYQSLNYQQGVGPSQITTLSSTEGINGSQGLQEVTIPAYTESVNGRYQSDGVHFSAESGVIKLSPVSNRNLIFDVPAGQTHTYVIDCTGVRNVNTSWLVNGSGHVVLYLKNSSGSSLRFNLNNGNGNRFIGGVVSGRQTIMPETPQMDIYTNLDVTFDINNDGRVCANIYGMNATLNVSGNTYHDYMFSGSFIGSEFNIGPGYDAARNLKFMADRKSAV